MELLKSIGNRLFIILLALDQLVCGVIWLRPDHTISGEIGFAAMSGKHWGLVAERIVDGMPWFGAGHCRNAIEWDEILKPPYKFWE